ncbi:hypothetical protein B0I35DRAFT_275743 [Stachybotrys elegans]|uniref:U6 snRNA phosphodiesterase n=1 Tax=Stachybotrys elegans TaxID=80388 RepID=A0A8K0SIX4_9HYPO|nr:hypothetical protein B0I35DRAFT_275743 [Stachybotrys elegans]
MALVDYSSSSSSSAASSPSTSPADAAPSDEVGPSAKRRKISASDSTIGCGAGSDMPPLPPAFHDLYASTVRQSNVDDPSLHQGRKRQIPHVVGNWPTHLYVEWHPTVAQHDVLVQLVHHIQTTVGDEAKLHTFLTSDLGAPLPLHISLSRPMSLTTNDKDKFFDKLTDAITTTSTTPFTVNPRGLAWYKSPDSNRNFLIMRVNSPLGAKERTSPNPELMSLLTRCNTVAAQFNQLPLYQRNKNEAVGTAFHISIAWTFDVPTVETSIKALDSLSADQFRQLHSWEIDVSNIKVKIGNIISSVALRGLGSRVESSRSIFER